MPAPRARSWSGFPSSRSGCTPGARRTWPTLPAAAQRRADLRRRDGRLWGRVLPVPERNLRVLEGGERIAAAGRELDVEYTPGHASHHVVYFDRSDGTAYVGDVAGVRIPPSDFVRPPTPPPDIDVEAWQRSIDARGGAGTGALALTHFGCVEDPPRTSADDERGSTSRPSSPATLLDEHGDTDGRRWRRSCDEIDRRTRRGASDGDARRCSRSGAPSSSSGRACGATGRSVRRASRRRDGHRDGRGPTGRRARADRRAVGRWRVIVLNDNHNTFDHVAQTLARVIPSVSVEQGYRFADQIHNSGRRSSGRASASRPSSTGSSSATRGSRWLRWSGLAAVVDASTVTHTPQPCRQRHLDAQRGLAVAGGARAAPARRRAAPRCGRSPARSRTRGRRPARAAAGPGTRGSAPRGRGRSCSRAGRSRPAARPSLPARWSTSRWFGSTTL